MFISKPKILFGIDMKIAGALHNPNDMTKNSYDPYRVHITVLSTSTYVTRIVHRL